MIPRLLVLVAVAALTVAFALWWRRRDGRVVEASGAFDARDLGFGKRDRALVTIVEFSGEGCAPCVVVRNRLEELARELPDVRIVTVDAGDRLDLSDRYHVRRVPTLFITDEKLRIRWRASGVPSDADLRSALLGPAWAGRPHHEHELLDRP